MKWLVNPLKSYRRVRFDRRYDSPLFFFLLDLTIGLIQILAIAALLMILWIIGSRFVGAPNSSTSQTTPTASVVAEEKTGTPAMIPAVAEATQTDKLQLKTVEPKLENAPAISNEVKPVVKLESDQQASNKTDVPVIVNEQWVLEQSSDNYTIQFRTSSDAEILRQFAPDIGSQTTLSIFPFKKSTDGEVIFGIATGLYENMEDALAAIEVMAPAAQEFGPWIRPLNVLQSEISDTVKNLQ